MSDSIALESMHGKIMLALRDVSRTLLQPVMPIDEIQVRESFGNEVTGHVYQGLTIQERGERYAQAPQGFQDVGYGCLFTLATSKRGDATLTNDLAIRCRETLRRHFHTTRLPVGEGDGIRHHNVKVQDATPQNPKAFPDYNLRQLLLTVWNRELTEGPARP
jgi:hypothetical protein